MVVHSPNENAKLAIDRRIFLFSRRSPKFHVGSGNGRQYKQTVSLGEFRKRLYRRLGATACNLTSLDLQPDRPCMSARCEYDYRHIVRRLVLSPFFSLRAHTKATLYRRSPRYLFVECHIPSLFLSPLPLSTFLHAPFR